MVRIEESLYLNMLISHQKERMHIVTNELNEIILEEAHKSRLSFHFS